MISIDFLNKVYKILDSQEYNLSFSPAKFKNYMLYCNGNFIGGLFDEELCFVYLQNSPSPVSLMLIAAYLCLFLLYHLSYKSKEKRPGFVPDQKL